MPTKTKPVKTKPVKTTKCKRGFASMSKKEQLRISSLGGIAISQNRKHMAKIGAIGGRATGAKE